MTDRIGLVVVQKCLAAYPADKNQPGVRRNVGGMYCIDNGRRQDCRCECKIKQKITSDIIQSIKFSPGTLCIPGPPFVGAISDPPK